jgi:DNA invertase Pin-like site-specific DNA recombinase
MRTGRRTKLTPELVKTFTDSLAEGNAIETAAAVAGISETTYYRWLQAGREAKGGAFWEFCEAIKRAEAESEAERVRRIRTAGQGGNWQADAWWLERRRPERWGRKDRHEVSGPDGGPLVVKGYAGVSPDDWEKGEKGSNE